MPRDCVEDRMAHVFDKMPRRRRRRHPLIESASNGFDGLADAAKYVDAVLASGIELYQRLLRLAVPRSFTPSSQVYHWRDDSIKMAEIYSGERGKWRHYSECCGEETSSTTECSSEDSVSETDNESPAAQDLPDAIVVEARAARLLSVASYCPDDRVLAVEQYLCKCGKCAQDETIAQDVAHIVTWREPQHVASVTRLLQAFSTYNEAIGYQVGMIETADECLSTWCGDEDQAFTSFVVLQDVVPFLCANAV